MLQKPESKENNPNSERSPSVMYGSTQVGKADSSISGKYPMLIAA
jgi:hypothetical protein